MVGKNPIALPLFAQSVTFSVLPVPAAIFATGDVSAS